MAERRFKATFDFGGQLASSFIKTFDTADRKIIGLGRSIRQLDSQKRLIDKMDFGALRQAKRNTREAAERLADLKREIQQAENPTDDLKQAFLRQKREVEQLEKAFDKQLRTYRTYNRQLKEAGVNTRDLRQESRRLGDELVRVQRSSSRMRFGQGLGQMGGQMRGMGGTLIGAGAATVGSLFGAGAVGRNTLEQQARLASLGLSPSDIEAARAVARQADVRRNISQEQAFASQYSLVSAGLSAAQSRAGTPVAALVSRATDGEAEAVSNILATAYQNFGQQFAGDDLSKFGQIGDLFTKLQQQYQFANFDQLGAGFAEAAGSIGAFKVNVTQAGAAIGQLNNAGVQGSRAGTALSAVLRNLSQASEEYGFAIQRDADGQLDLIATLQGLDNAMQGMDIDERANELQRIFGEEGMRGISPLLDNLPALADGYKQVMAGAAGAAKAGADAKNELSINDDLMAMGNAAKDAGTSFLVALTPVIVDFSNAFGRTMDQVGSFITEHPKLVSTVALGAAAFGTLAIGVGGTLVALGSLAGAVSSIITIWPTLVAGATLMTGTILPAMGAAFAGVGAAIMATPIGWIIGGITLLAGAAFLIYKYWEPIGDFFKGLWGGIGKALGGYLDMQMAGFKLMGDFIGGIWEMVSNPIQWIGEKFDWIGGKIGSFAKWLGWGDEEQKATPSKTTVEAASTKQARAAPAGQDITRTVGNITINVYATATQSVREIAQEVARILGGQEALYDGI